MYNNFNNKHTLTTHTCIKSIRILYKQYSVIYINVESCLIITITMF